MGTPVNEAEVRRMIVGKTKGRPSKLPLSAPLDVGADHQFLAPSENGRTTENSHGISEGRQPVRYIPKENHKLGSMGLVRRIPALPLIRKLSAPGKVVEGAFSSEC